MSLTFIFILYTHLHLGLPSGFYPFGFPTNILHAVQFSIRVTCSVNPIVLDLVSLIILGEEHDIHMKIVSKMLGHSVEFSNVKAAEPVTEVSSF
jgi:hypothetical protein